jgi:signal peptidase I
VSFDVDENQLFVMGDNSPESKDCRLWTDGDLVSGIPGGRYLDRRLLIGKAICVFWPHSWGGVPGLPKLPGWPNFRDMRLVR